jgi:hypothetical protein
MPESQTAPTPAPTPPAPRKTSSLTVLTAALVAGAVALFGVRFLSNARGGPEERRRDPAPIATPAPVMPQLQAPLAPPAAPSAAAPVAGLAGLAAPAMQQPPPAAACPIQNPALAQPLLDEDQLPPTAAVTRLNRYPAQAQAAPCPAAPVVAAPVAAELAPPRAPCPTAAAAPAPAAPCAEAAPAAPVRMPVALPALAATPPAPAPSPNPAGLALVDVTQDPAALEAGLLTVGVTVKAVTQRSLGQQAGLQTGDRIVSVAGQPVASVFHFFYVLAQLPEGDAARLVVVRGGKPLRLTWPARSAP